MRFSGFFVCYSVSHFSNKPTLKIIDWSFLCQWANVQNQQGIKYFFFSTVHVTGHCSEARIQWIQHPVKEWVIGIVLCSAHCWPPLQGRGLLTSCEWVLEPFEPCTWLTIALRSEEASMWRRKILKQGCQQGRTYPLGKGRRLPWAPKSQGPPKMLFIYEMRIKRRHANGCCLRCLLPRQPSACLSWTCFLCILLVANENIMHLTLIAARARGLSFPARAHLSLSLSLSLCVCSVQRACFFS